MIGDLLGLSLQPAAMIDTMDTSTRPAVTLDTWTQDSWIQGAVQGAGNNRYIGASCREGAHFYPRNQQWQCQAI